VRDAATRPVTLPSPKAGSSYAVVFVCTGNICRSPMAEVVTRALAEGTMLRDGTTLGSHLTVSSAGTGPWHEGSPMHELATEALLRAGFPDHPHVAHQFSTALLETFDLIVALDRRHQQTLRGLGTSPDRLFLLRSFDLSSGAAADVPDPYYGDHTEFDACLNMITAGCRGLVDNLTELWSPGAVPPEAL
jgi:low molecular weight protein-tyrosine phosphatase